MPTEVSLHILIVDPDTSSAHVTRAIVARAAPDARISVEPDAEQACHKLARLLPDVLIVDPSPSLLAGLKLIATVKGQHAGQVIVVASAPSLGLRRRMHALGVDLYLEKPAPLLVSDLRTFLNSTQGKP
jgi:DNA-binding NarL/FixJ family response regulator